MLYCVKSKYKDLQISFNFIFQIYRYDYGYNKLLQNHKTQYCIYDHEMKLYSMNILITTVIEESRSFVVVFVAPSKIRDTYLGKITNAQNNVVKISNKGS